MDKKEEEVKLLKECKNILSEIMSIARPCIPRSIDELATPTIERLDKAIEYKEHKRGLK